MVAGSGRLVTAEYGGIDEARRILCALVPELARQSEKGSA
jgi:hypothetical protein